MRFLRFISLAVAFLATILSILFGVEQLMFQAT